MKSRAKRSSRFVVCVSFDVTPGLTGVGVTAYERRTHYYHETLDFCAGRTSMRLATTCLFQGYCLWSCRSTTARIMMWKVWLNVDERDYVLRFPPRLVEEHFGSMRQELPSEKISTCPLFHVESFCGEVKF